MNGGGPRRNNRQKYCFFRKSKSHSAADSRKTAAKRARGEWKEHPRADSK
jgi:hypothetical protein